VLAAQDASSAHVELAAGHLAYDAVHAGEGAEAEVRPARLDVEIFERVIAEHGQRLGIGLAGELVDLCARSRVSEFTM
jgi:hypothetical protein